MSDSVGSTGISTTAIDGEQVAGSVRSDRSGAVVRFDGVVRNHDAGRAVTGIEYSHHPSAEQVLAEVAQEVAARHPECRVAVVHRVGKLGIGDVAMVAAVASAHRSSSFAAIADLVDTVKAKLPVWKRQIFPDGTDEWVGSN